MALVMRLCDIDATAGTLYDFLTGELKPVLGSWKTAPGGDGKTTETMQLASVTGTDANIIAAVQKIDELRDQVRDFFANKKTGKSIWFEINAAAETAKRALVYSITLVPVNVMTHTALLGYKAGFYQLTIVRDELWEDKTLSVIQTGVGGVTTLGGTDAISATPGSAPGRISYATFSAISGGGGPLTKVWAGIRPAGPGTANFSPMWELENGTRGTDATLVTDAAASPDAGANNAVNVDFGTDTSLVERIGMTVDQSTASTNFHHFTGDYLVLARCYLTAAGTVGIQMKTGYTSNATYVARPEKYITNTAYQFIELGEISLPPFAYRDVLQATVILKNFEIQLHAERVAGTPQLRLDCLVLIPTAHFLKAAGASINFSGTASRLTVYTHEDGEKASINWSTADEPDAAVVAELRNWQVPIEGGVAVVAAERAAGSTHTDVIYFEIDYYVRHRTYQES